MYAFIFTSSTPRRNKTQGCCAASPPPIRSTAQPFVINPKPDIQPHAAFRGPMNLCIYINMYIYIYIYMYTYIYICIRMRIHSYIRRSLGAGRRDSAAQQLRIGPSQGHAAGRNAQHSRPSIAPRGSYLFTYFVCRLVSWLDSLLVF